MKGDLIPNGEILYRYVNPKSFPQDQEEIPFGIFEEFELSCDWERYQKYPEDSFHVREGKKIIIKITVCDEIRFPRNPKRATQEQPAWIQEIIHDPIRIGEDELHPNEPNESHSLIRGKKRFHITKAIATHSEIYKQIP